MSSALFQIIDKTNGIDQLIWFIVTKNEGGTDSLSINVISNSWAPNSMQILQIRLFIRQIRIVGTGTFSSNKFYIQLDRVAYTTQRPTNNIDIRLYNNTYSIPEGKDTTTPWILDSNNPSGTINVTLTISLKDDH